jgi:beta-galactosidase
LYINATVVDENGVIVPDASNLITFDISGPGTIAAVDNGDNASHEPFHAKQRSAFHGSCIAVLRATSSTGQIIVNASALGLKSGAVAVTTTRPSPAAP